MKKILYLLSKLVYFLKSQISPLRSYFWLDKLSLIFLGLALVFNIIIWIFWRQSHFTLNYMYLSSSVLLINAFLSLLFSRKDILIGNFLSGTALLVQLAILIYLRYFLSLLY